MQDIDLDAIRARYEAARLPYSAAYRVGDIHPAYNDVPALLARLAEVEAELDAAHDAVTEAMNHNDATCAVVAERDAMRPVVEAAEAWSGHAASLGVRANLNDALKAAVDAYRAGRDARGD